MHRDVKMVDETFNLMLDALAEIKYPDGMVLLGCSDRPVLTAGGETGRTNYEQDH